MAYGDFPLDAPEKPNKGLEGGACNRRSCQAEPALWWNHGSYAWYCGDCARDIGEDVVNKRGWDRDWRPKVGHAQFETREEIDAREGQYAPGKITFDSDVPAEVIAEKLAYTLHPHQRETARVLTGGKLYFPTLRPPSPAMVEGTEAHAEIDRRYYVVARPAGENRQQRRARERAERKAAR